VYYEDSHFHESIEDLDMIIEHELGQILLDDEDAYVLNNWQFLTIQEQIKGKAHYKYAVLYSERTGGHRKARFLAREIMKIDNTNVEVCYINGNRLDCRKNNLTLRDRTWNRNIQKKAEQNAERTVV
jgi:hypothetical protein